MIKYQDNVGPSDGFTLDNAALLLIDYHMQLSQSLSLLIEELKLVLTKVLEGNLAESNCLFAMNASAFNR